MENSTSSLSNTISKYGSSEEMSMYQASIDDSAIRLAERIGEEAISNERICSGEDILNTYTVVSDAVHGGMGSVWRVHHKNWNVDLAMKRPQARFFAEGSETRKEEFIKECENWIGLGLHPNIVSCFYVRDIGGIPTIFSEWMDGGSLKDRIRDDSLYAGTEEDIRERILDIAIQSARGLKYSHDKGLIHQDMKPGNLLLTKEWDARLGDFGLARAQSQLSEGNTSTYSAYTLEYCPFEQTKGIAPERWMDIYAWALTVLEMYTGKRMWKTGAEAKELRLKEQEDFRVLLSAEMMNILKKAFGKGYEECKTLLNDLKDAYAAETGMPYARPEPAAAADTADSMNNRALSFLDLGKEEQAEKIWNDAIRTDNSSFRCHYNLAVFLWQANRISSEELRDRILTQKEDSELFREADKSTGFAVLETVNDIRRRIYQTGINEPLPEKPYYEIKRNHKGENPPGYDLNDYECRLDNGDRIMDDSADKVRRLGFDAEGRRYWLDDALSGRTWFRTFLPDEYRKERNTLTAKRFVDPKGSIIVDESHYGLYFFNAENGRSLLTYHLKIDSEGDEIFEHVKCFSENGFVCAGETWKEGWWMKLPPADPAVPFFLSRIASFSQRQSAMRRLIRFLPEAEEAFQNGEVERCYEALSPSCDDGTLLMHEEALALWEKLFAWYEPEKLITVIPEVPDSEDDGRWIPQGGDPEEPAGPFTEGAAGDEYTSLTCTYTYYTKENYNNSMDVDLFYTVNAQDAISGRPFYTLSFQESESDDHIFSYAESFKIRGQYLWAKKPEEKSPWHMDLADPAVQQKMNMSIALPGGYWLKNTENEVDIGGFVFEDFYEGLDLLSDQAAIRCRNHSYRLIYTYGKRRETRTGLWKEYAAQHPVLPHTSTTSAAKVIRNEDIRQGDNLEGEIIVDSDPLPCREGCKWTVHRKGEDTEISMRRYDPARFAEGGDLTCEEVLEGAARWISLGTHEHILACYDVRTIGGAPVLLCQKADGRSLAEMIGDSSLYEGSGNDARKRILSIACQAAQGLRYAHKKKVTHNGMCTENVIVNSAECVKLDRTGLAIPSPNQRTHDVFDWALTVLQMYAGKILPYTDTRKDLENDDILFRIEPSQDMKKYLADCLGYYYSDLGRAEELCREEMNRGPEQDVFSTTGDIKDQNISEVVTEATQEGRRPGLFARIRARRDRRKGTS